MSKMKMNNLMNHSNVEYDHELFTKIAEDIRAKGFSICPNALPNQLANDLLVYIQQTRDQFSQAKIGRDSQLLQDQTIRSDEIFWINQDNRVGQQWLDWAGQLQSYLNSRLFLGLFSFESHFASYQKGDFYKRHVDSFVGAKNRVLSMVVYLNKDWQSEDGGEFVLYQDENDQQGMTVEPNFATVVLFLSEEFPHEVKPAFKERYSIAGWFRVNTSSQEQIDPPS